MQKGKILVAALNWGLGHATRCVPIIMALEKQGFLPIIASDGAALHLLKKEFPHLEHKELPSYQIEYSRNILPLKWKLLMNSPKLLKAIKEEQEVTEKLTNDLELQGIISDNRFGVRSKTIKKNVYITHQLNVLSGNTTFLSSYIHRNFINKFQECWVPDQKGSNNLSGILGHPEIKPNNTKYIGSLSRFKKLKIPVIYDYLVLLSGPEPQRSLLESILLKELKSTEMKVLFIRGIVTEEVLKVSNPNIHIKNFLFGKTLEEALNSSKYIIARSGYSSLMDLAKLEKKAFFIPTPGQYEQQYLARRIKKLGIAPFCQQEKFEISKLKEIENYEGLSNFRNHTIFRDLFTFFHSK